MGAHAPGSVRVTGTEPGPTVNVYDLTVPGTHNFVAGGIVVHNCVFEIIERCPPERHKEGKGCETCPLREICKEKEIAPDGTERWKPGPGRAARANGWMNIDDVISKFKSITWEVFRAQWLSERPETSGLVFPRFDPEKHVIDYVYNPNFPVACGIDFGYVNPNVCLAIQMLPNDDLVICDEIYVRQHTADEFAKLIKQKPWFSRVKAFIADPANRGDRETLNKHGVSNMPADKSQKKGESSVENGLNLMRWLFTPMGRPRPMLYVARHCVNTIKEAETYHIAPVTNSDEKDPAETPSKVDDHAMDAARYVLTWLFRGQLNV